MIEWNEYTWYSKLGAIILFILVVPVLAFYVGVQYEETLETLDSSNTYPTIPNVIGPVVQDQAIGSSSLVSNVKTASVTSNLSDVNPLYPNVNWGTISAATTTLGTLNLKGAEIVSMPVGNVSDLSGESKPFYNYYDSKLKTLGYTLNPMLAADGAGSSIWGYQKGNTYVILSYTSTPQNQNQNEPFACPCSLEFSVFIGTAQ
jgi:hypothetical protein